MQKNGAHAPKLQFARSPIEGFGTFATSAIEAGELTISLPRRVMITAAQAPQALVSHAAVVEATARVPELQSLLPVAVALLSEDEAGARSFYAPYLATLPRSVETPDAYDPELRAQLRGTSVEPLLRRHGVIETTAADSGRLQQELQNLVKVFLADDIRGDARVYQQGLHSIRCHVTTHRIE